MTTYIPAVVTDTAGSLWPQMIGGILPFETASYFKVGEGGWIDPGTGAVPRTPDPALTDLDCIINPGSYPADGRAVFQKSFGGGDLTYVAPGTLRCRLFLDFGEFNDDGFGNSPVIWECGVYDTDDNLVAYGTFQSVTKNITVQIERFVNITFTGA